jgi:hypothetical protein
VRSYLKNKQGVVPTLIILTTQEIEVVGSWVKTSPGTFSTKPYLKNKQKAKGLLGA